MSRNTKRRIFRNILFQFPFLSLGVPLVILLLLPATSSANTCRQLDVFLLTTAPPPTEQEPPLYILYDVNPVEGFNLRRDVYIRMAVFFKSLKESTHRKVRLVLPPFSELFHWRSREINQKHIFWNTFFDLASLKLYTDVIDMWEFWDEIRPYLKHPQDDVQISEVYRLRHYKVT